MLSFEADKEAAVWYKMSIPLQYHFLRHVDLETEKCWSALLRRNVALEGFAREMEFHEIPECEGWKKLKVAFVGSSYSLFTSRELELDYGIYSAGYAVFLGNSLIQERYYTGVLSKDQTSQWERSEIILKLLCTNLEREAALHCLKRENLDFIVINGDFCQFSPGINEVLDERVENGKFENGKEVVKDTIDKSVELMKSLKTFYLISDARTSALDGWMIYRYDDDSHCVGLNDSSILTRLMPRNSWFAYRWIFVKPGLHNYLSGLRETYLRYTGKETFREIFRLHKEKVKSEIKKVLGNPVDIAEKTSRYYLRKSSEYQPLCLETHIDVEAAPLITYLIKVKWKFELPYPIEFIKECVSLPSRFGAEFVEKVKRRLLEGIEAGKLNYKQINAGELEGNLSNYYK